MPSEVASFGPMGRSTRAKNLYFELSNWPEMLRYAEDWATPFGPWAASASLILSAGAALVLLLRTTYTLVMCDRPRPRCAVLVKHIGAPSRN